MNFQFSLRLLQRPLASPALPECKTAPPKDLTGTIPTYDSIVKTRKTKLNPGYMTYYKKPLYITQGSMQWLWDDQGDRYLDLFGGIVTVSVGHCHPHVSIKIRIISSLLRRPAIT